MANGLLVGNDELVAAWAFSTFSLFPTKVDRALGVMTKEGIICGAILFQNFNGTNIELSYYGPKTLTPGIIRAMARIMLTEFNVARATVVTSKRNTRFMKSLLKFGFRLEGAQRRYYGQADCKRNTGVRFVLFKEDIAKIARIVLPQSEQNKV